MNRQLRLLRTPATQILVIFAGLLLIAVPAAGGASLLPNLAAAVLPAVLIDILWVSIEARRLRLSSGALITALIVFMILSPNESWLVVGWTSVFAILSKRILRTERQHIFNPAALALVWSPIAFGSGESWWGGLGDVSWAWIAVLLVVGAYLTDRLNKFPLVLTFLATYFAFFTVVSVGNAPAVAEMFRQPFLQAALFLSFFMLTDPPTSPNRYPDQVWFGLLAAIMAVAAQLLGAGQVFLLVGLLIANAVLAIVRYARRREASALVGAVVPS